MAPLNAGETIRSIVVEEAPCEDRSTDVGGRKQRTLSSERADWLRQRCRSGPFATRGLFAELAESGMKTERRAIWVVVRAEGLSFRKAVLPAEQTRVDIARRRLRWKIHQWRIEAQRWFFSMRPGSRPISCLSGGHWKPLTFIAALRCDRIDASWVIDGPINSELFTLYVHRSLVPTLAKGDIVIIDNVGSHKGQAVRRAVQTAGAHLFFLPPYSSDLNLIKQVFAKLKHLIMREQARAVEATWRKAGEILDCFWPTECADYLANSEYTSA